jgi:hypothetical protein
METLGTFTNVKTAARAAQALFEAGFREDEITSFSSIPYPDGVLVKTEQRSWHRWLSLAGLVFGAAVGFLLAAGTAWLYPVQTGDKPIITYYPTAIIGYEIGMLCAIAGAVIGMFLEIGLPPWRRKVYDPSIAEGNIGICVTAASDEQKTRAEQIMQQAGALRITSEANL